MAAEAVGAKDSRGLDLFKVAGIQIRLDYSWLVVFVLVISSLSAGYFPRHYPNQSSSIYWLAGLVATLFFFASILVHELGISNLFPGFPLDGGRVFRAFWWWKTGSLTQVKLAE